MEVNSQPFSKVGFFFGAGAEVSYGLPSGGRFALDIFKGNAEKEKKFFRELIEKVDVTSTYANDWLPQNYKNKRVSAFGKAEFLSLIESSIEYRKKQIICFFNEFDDRIKKRLSKWDLTEEQVKKSFFRDTGVVIGDIHYGHSVELNKALNGETTLFESDYFSAMLEVMKRFPNDKPLRNSLGSVLQLLVGSFGQELIQTLNQEVFQKAPEDIPVFDDVSGLFRIEFARAGLAALELILEDSSNKVTTETQIASVFGELLKVALEDLFAEALDYQALIDSHYRYLYQPRAEWAKFCKISIFLYTARNYIVNGAKECMDSIEHGTGYYHDLLNAKSANIKISTIGTTNYNNLIEKVVTGVSVIHLNGNVDDYYDPYSNKIQSVTQEELADQGRILVPFIFTQSGIKPLTSVEMSRKYVRLFDEYKDSDAVVITGFAFNGDDGHINGLFRELLDEHGKKIIVVCLKGDKSDDELKREYRRRLRAKTAQKLFVLQIDPETRKTASGKLWLDAVSSMASLK
jgi:hypothetical protein